ncbi:uncharacterized protein FOMMEDRAFT_169293 [Fomitiporia mediterranea MF3/22]|uniref:uncharacterized protein n=1 Tax=Fomitiporia mediterranea (strain MF3/22) TaxID=694068 RepID=UPI00044096A0|nr:uncharacterized protein FOMMEDRAFT_169293 [Fomitiporia mediterranea MF3/22]EJD01109.1 hypothetical protein FOMMEDRAFT_169293 [Fomitiporia mediterranea MF3/22]
MNADNSPLLRRARRSYSAIPGSPRVFTLGTSPFSSAPKVDNASTRQQFSKLSSSTYNANAPVEAVDTQDCKYSEDTFSLNRGGHGSSSASFTQEHFSSSRPPFINSSEILARHPQYVSAASKTQTTGNTQKVFSADESRCSDGTGDLMEPDSYARNSSKKILLKRESGGFSSPFDAETSGHFDPHNDSMAALAKWKVSDYRAATPHRRSLTTDSNEGDQGRISRLRSSLQNINSRDSLSKSSPKVMSADGQSGDDLSDLMYKGATDLRNAKRALEEKTIALQRVEEELVVRTSEKDDLLKRTAVIKEKTKTELESQAKKLNDIVSQTQSLKSRSEECFSFVQEAEASLPDVKNLKEEIQKSVDQLEASIGEDGSYVPTQGWKSVLNELQAEMTNKQQIIDIFRDRLECAQGDLAEAKNRVAELEGLHTQHSNALHSMSEKLSDTGDEVDQQENASFVSKNAELEAAVATSAKQIAELKQRLSQKEAEVQSITALQRELEKHRTLAEERAMEVKSLRCSRERLSRVEELLRDRESRIIALEASESTKSASIETLQRNLAVFETNTANQLTISQHLEQDLDACRTQVQAEYELRTKLINDNDTLKASEAALVAELDVIKTDIEDCRIKLRQSETRNEALQERFEDQSMMLQMEKKAHGDAQERLLSVEASCARAIEDARRNTDAQVTNLNERLRTLEGFLRDSQAQLKAKTNEYSTVLSDTETKHAQEVKEIKENLAAKLEEVARLQRELDSSKDEARALHEKMHGVQQESNNLQKELSEAKLPSQAQIEAVIKLTSRIDELQKANEVQAQRAGSIILRYEKGDLSAGEKKLIEMIHRTTQTSHEQQLVAKGNEIRQRDNAIKELGKRKAELEMQLARLLNVQARSRVTPDPNGPRSLIDEAWMSSQASTSPQTGEAIAKAPDRDRPTTLTETEAGPDEPSLILSSLVSSIKPNAVLSVNKTKTVKSKKAGISPPHAPTFAKLSEGTLDPSDTIQASDDDIALTDLVASKRKRDTTETTVKETERARPLRRTKTATRTLSRNSDGSAQDPKGTTVVPKVKARKRR